MSSAWTTRKAVNSSTNSWPTHHSASLSTHRWRQHDRVLWDNLCALHRGLPFDDLRFSRDMPRATVLDVANTCEQAGVAAPVIDTVGMRGR